VASDLPPRRSASGPSAAGRPPARRPGLARGRLAAIGLAALLLAGAALFAARRARPPGSAAPAPAEAPAAPAQPAEGLAPATVAARVAAASALAGCGEQAGRAFFVGPEEAVADVACRAGEAQLLLADGRDLLGKVTWRDALAGLSILEVPGAAAPHLPIGSAAGLAAGEPVFLVAEDGPGMAIAEVAMKNPVKSTAATRSELQRPNTRWPTDDSEVRSANWVALTADVQTDIRNATNAAVPIALARLSTSTAAQNTGRLLPVMASSA